MAKPLNEMTIADLAAHKAELAFEIEKTAPGSSEEAGLLRLVAEVREEMTRQNCPLVLSGQKLAAELADDELLLQGAQRSLLPTPEDFDPTSEEIRSHDGDRRDYGYIVSNRINNELKRRNLKGRAVRPWWQSKGRPGARVMMTTGLAPMTASGARTESEVVNTSQDVIIPKANCRLQAEIEETADNIAQWESELAELQEQISRGRVRLARLRQQLGELPPAAEDE